MNEPNTPETGIVEKLTQLFRDGGIVRPDMPAELAAGAARVNMAAGATLMNMGDLTNELYFIESGRVAVFHRDPITGEERHITDLGAGELLGEIAMIDSGPRTLSARAESDCALIELSPSRILDQPGGEYLLTELRGALSRYLVPRMRFQTDRLVDSLSREIATARSQHQFGKFFLFVLGLCAVAMLGGNIVAAHMDQINVKTQAFAWSYLAVLLLPSLGAMWALKVPMAEIGLTRERLADSTREGVIISLGLAAATAAAVIGSRVLDAVPDLPFSFDPVGATTYFLHSFLQELVARGFMLTSFRRFLNDKKGYLSVVVTSTFFGVFHIHFGLAAVAAIIVSSLMFGAFYLRHQNLAGVTLIHFAIGVCAFSLDII